MEEGEEVEVEEVEVEEVVVVEEEVVVVMKVRNLKKGMMEAAAVEGEGESERLSD